MCHPDVWDETGEAGLPLQLTKTEIEIRLHGVPLEDYDPWIDVVQTSTAIRAAFGTSRPEILADSEEHDSVRLGRLTKHVDNAPGPVAAYPG